MDNRLDTINELFSRLPNFILEKKFEENDTSFRGEFIVTTQKLPLYFVSIIPMTYPFGEIKFYTKTVKGYPHQIYLDDNLGGAICLNTPFVNDFRTKLDSDTEKLCIGYS